MQKTPASRQDGTPHSLDLALGNAIKVRRTAKGMTQATLAEAIGVTFQQVQKYERGANRVSFSMLVKIAQALQTRVSELIADLDQMDPADNPDARVRELLAQPDAFALLETFATIRSMRMRRAVLDLAKNVAGE